MTVAEDIVGLTIVSIFEGVRCSQGFFFVCALLVVDVFRLDRKSLTYILTCHRPRNLQV